MQDRFDKDGLLKKEYWEPGEWHDEPDTFEMTYKGYKCEGRRNAMGSWCGYVLIPFDDPFYTDLDEEHYDEVPLEVHGGVTWYRVHSKFRVIRDEYHISHQPELFFLPRIKPEVDIHFDILLKPI